MVVISSLPILCTAELDTLAAIHADPACSIIGTGTVPPDRLLDLHSTGVLVKPAYYERDGKPWPVSARGLAVLRRAGLIADVPPIECVAAVRQESGYAAMEGAPVQPWPHMLTRCPYAIPVKGEVPLTPGWTHVFSGHDGPGTSDWFVLLRLPPKTPGTRIRVVHREPGFSLSSTEGMTGTLSPPPFAGECKSCSYPNSSYSWFIPDGVWKSYWDTCVTRLDKVELLA
ncbi:hypothetical protein F1643_20895 [Azospirillum sp. INR13]|uniref:hypothetical protein n=1 Tax=Azospirillum sp. INR13 TaxID=2596919 RepID=UPI0018920475|nr:hypothetical protein [Azospirillum sp. INR13]MBF5096457.1 hypothetical protein [Azospirillum sp. INR13]